MYNYYEVCFEGDYSICILGNKKPNNEEAENFCKNDCKDKVLEVLKISKNEAHSFFDMENEKNFPIFG